MTWTPDQIVLRRVDELIPYARNSRTHSQAQINQIAASIREFGFTNPVIIDGDKGIIAGHGRVEAARLLGMTEVPTIEASHFTDAQRRAYILADNRLALSAGWDFAMLATELDSLKDAGFDPTLAGFTENEIADILAAANSIPVDAPEDFKSFDEGIDVDYRCPSCGFEWSGKPKS